MQKLQQDKTGAIRVKPRKWFRPRSIKKMLIEMDKPFVWPEVPEDLELYVVLLFPLTSSHTFLRSVTKLVMEQLKLD